MVLAWKHGGSVIQTANAALEKALQNSKHASKLIYYDVFGFMMSVMENKDDYGLTQSLGSYCDGDASSPNDMWCECTGGSYTWEGATHFYWMNFIQPTTTVHKLIAADMKARIDRFLGLEND